VSPLIGLGKAHALPQTATALTLWTVVAAALGAWDVPTFQSGHVLPLWGLYPGVAAAVLAVSGANAAGWLERQCAHGVGARDRLVVALVLVAMAGAGSVLVGWALDVPELCVLSVIVLGLALGAGVVHPALPYAVAFGAGIVPMVFCVLFNTGQPIQVLLRVFGSAGVAVGAAAGLVGVALYCLRGFPLGSAAEV
jgi:hypothetical protein